MSFALSEATLNLGRQLGPLALTRKPRYLCEKPPEPASIEQGLSWLAQQKPTPTSVGVLGATGLAVKNRAKLFHKTFRGTSVTVYERLEIGLRRPFVSGSHDLLILLNALRSFDKQVAPLSLVNYMSGLSVGGRLAIQDSWLAGPTLGLDLSVLGELGLAAMSRRVTQDETSGVWLHILTRERESDRLDAIAPELTASLKKYEDVAGEY